MSLTSGYFSRAFQVAYCIYNMRQKIVLYLFIVVSVVVLFLIVRSSMSRQSRVQTSWTSWTMGSVNQFVSLSGNFTPGPPLSSSSSPSGNHVVYVMSLFFMGQQGVAVKGLASLQCWAATTGLPTLIVEPAISSSSVTGNIGKANSTLGDLFSLEHFNSVSRSAGLPGIIPANQYLNLNAKKIILVSRDSNEVDQVWPRPDSTNSEACYQEGIPFRGIIAPLLRRGYCIVKYVETPVEMLTPQLTKEILAPWINQNVTIVFTRFGPMQIQEMSCPNTSVLFQPSSMLLGDTEKYKKLYLGPNHRVAVMMRTEKVIRFQGVDKLLQCFNDTVATTRKLQGDDTGLPMVTADSGQYGSSSWHWFIKDNATIELGRQEAKKTLETLLKHRLSFQEWEESFELVASRNTGAYM